MVERKSKKMEAHKNVIRKSTIWMIVVTVLTILYADSWVKNNITSYMDHRYYSDPSFA
jgi:Ca2+/H+ antiporter